MGAKNIILLVFISITMTTCTYNVYNPDINFQKNVLPIFVSKCAMSGCHNSVSREAGYDLSNYDGIMKGVVANHPLMSEVYKQISGFNPEMPVGGKLKKEEISYIKLWIKMGAQNNSDNGSCDTSNFSYTLIVKPILTNWCVTCHSSANASGTIDLSTYSAVAVSAANKKLVGSIKQLSGYSPMPQGNKLNDCDIKLIEKWVNAGYPNN